MGLTPSSKDPNRANELKRKKKTPEAFGTSTADKLPKDWKPTGLPSSAKDSKVEKAAEDEMKALIESVPDMSDEDLITHAESGNQDLVDAVYEESGLREKKVLIDSIPDMDGDALKEHLTSDDQDICDAIKSEVDSRLETEKAPEKKSFLQSLIS